ILAACCALPNAYRLKGMRIEGLGIVTNKSFFGAYRGYGKDKAIKFIERVMDQIAKELNMMPEDVRFKNFIQPNEFPFKQINNYTYDSGDYPATMKKAIQMADINTWREKQRELRKQGRYLGIGLSFIVEPAGTAVPNCLLGGITQARIKINSDGTVEVQSDWTEIGQGADRSQAKIVSNILGCNFDDVLVAPVTSDLIGQGPISSRGAVYPASAITKAARALREKLLKFAGIFLEEKPENIETRGGVVCSVINPQKQITFKELAQRAYLSPGPRGLTGELLREHEHLLDATATWYSPVTADTGAIYTTFCSSVDIAVVEVDVETGVTQILKYVHVHDAGNIIDSKIVDGQIHGGIVQGIGEALSEELIYSDNGQLLNTSHADFLMPTVADSPDIQIGHLQNPSPFTELGTKGMGEAPIIGGKAVTLSAIEDALSPFHISIIESPATRERVRKWILESQLIEKKRDRENT
ncbi:MAG TPA: molybdopterin cofactor-binding domain-containing protein, partial [Desulfatiglandales bacterium]|nr:molybdopterin cofactor-binding domain-containing protein [Desulfatiglandales bacterium]